MRQEELDMSMFVFIQEHGERIIRATANACRMVAVESNKELDGTSEKVWTETAEMIEKAAAYLEEH